VQVWLDTRNMQSVHRASRFCHHFCLLPVGGGTSGKQPVGVQLAIPRAKEDAPLVNSSEIRVNSSIVRDGYNLEAWIPAPCLHGFDPEASSRMGFYYRLRDAELLDPSLSVGHEFPFATDPSLWSTLELRP